MTRSRSTRHGRRNNGIRCRNPKFQPRLSVRETLARLRYGMQDLGQKIGETLSPPIDAMTVHLMEFRKAIEDLFSCPSRFMTIDDPGEPTKLLIERVKQHEIEAAKRRIAECGYGD